MKTQLVTLLTAELTGIQVTYGEPGDAIEREAVFVGNARGRHDIAGIKAGRKARHEEFTVDVYFQVEDPDGTQEVAELRAWTLAKELEDLLADDPHIGLSPADVEWAKAGDFESLASRHDMGARAGVRLQVECRTRLT